MKMLSSCRQQKSKSFHIRGIVSEAELQNVHIRYILTRTELNGSHNLIFMFEWTIFPGLTTLTPLQEVQNMMGKNNIQPESFKDRIIFMSMCSGIDWSRKGNEESCPGNSSSVAAGDREFPRGHWSFLGPGSEEKCCATLAHKSDGSQKHGR